MKKYNRFIALIMGAVVLSSILYSRSFRVNQIPNGNVFSCANCHVNPAGGGERNKFGKIVESNFLVLGNVTWNNDLANLDSDADGFTNGFELGDPNGSWVMGTDNPGSPNFVTNPGDANSLVVSEQSNNINNFSLQQNYPNPFNPSTKIQFNISNDMQLKLIVFDLMGNEVKTIINEFLPTGAYSATWDGTNNTGIKQSGGVYFYQLQAGVFVQTNKMVLLK